MRLPLIVSLATALTGCTLYFGDPNPPGPGGTADAAFWPVGDAAEPWPDAPWAPAPDAAEWPTPDAAIYYPDAQPINTADAGPGCGTPVVDAAGPVFYPDAGP